MALSLKIVPYFSLLFLPFPASAITLAWPVACEYGKTCFVQNYVDHDTLDGAQDFTCNALTYNGHTGTDIRLRNMVEMKAGVDVLAATPGVVRGTRNDVPDEGIWTRDKTILEEKECGNGVTMTTPDGYEIQYCHIKQGSVTVKTGDAVNAGQILGKVGLSGMTEFPHLHFEIRDGKTVMDPFTGAPMNAACNTGGAALWNTETVRYLPSAILNAGFSEGPVEYQRIKAGFSAPPILPVTTRTLVFWVEAMGVHAGDTAHLAITGPDGAVLAENTVKMDRAKATSYVFIGKKRPGDAWPVGTYTGTYTLTREKPAAGEEPVTVTQTVKVE